MRVVQGTAYSHIRVSLIRIVQRIESVSSHSTNLFRWQLIEAFFHHRDILFDLILDVSPETPLGGLNEKIMLLLPSQRQYNQTNHGKIEKIDITDYDDNILRIYS